MAGHTYSSILLHVVFSTKERRPLIRDSFQERLYKYMAGIAKKEFGHAIQIGGVEDHIHGLIRLRTDVSVAEAMRKWKSLSSGWVNETIKSTDRFAWQTGYAAFSVSKSNSPTVQRYILNQREHHKKRDFKDEFLTLLRRHEIEFDPKYVWD